MTAAPRLVYETETCSRCGGSGTYSYCQMYGSTCFKCSGRKRSLSRRGAKASAAVGAFIAERFSKAVETLEVGDRISLPGYARAVVVDAPKVSGSYSIAVVDGVEVKTPYIAVQLRTGAGEVNYGTPPGTMIKTRPGGANWLEVVAFARTLKGVEVIEPAPVDATDGEVERAESALETAVQA